MLFRSHARVDMNKQHFRRAILRAGGYLINPSLLWQRIHARQHPGESRGFRTFKSRGAHCGQDAKLPLWKTSKHSRNGTPLWFVKPDVGKPEANKRTCGRLWCAHAFEELSCDGVSVKVCDLWCDMNEQHFRRDILRAGVISSIQVCGGREFMPELT